MIGGRTGGRGARERGEGCLWQTGEFMREASVGRGGRRQKQLPLGVGSSAGAVVCPRLFPLGLSRFRQGPRPPFVCLVLSLLYFEPGSRPWAALVALSTVDQPEFGCGACSSNCSWLVQHACQGRGKGWTRSAGCGLTRERREHSPSPVFFVAAPPHAASQLRRPARFGGHRGQGKSGSSSAGERDGREGEVGGSVRRRPPPCRPSSTRPPSHTQLNNTADTAPTTVTHQPQPPTLLPPADADSQDAALWSIAAAAPTLVAERGWGEAGTAARDWRGVETDADGNVTSLDVSEGGLTDIPAGVLPALPSLATLLGSTNALRTLPGDAASLHQLTALHLANNALTELPAVVCDLPALRVLVVGLNPLKALPADLSRLTLLEWLDASECKLAEAGMCGALTALTRLDLHSNLLASLPPTLGRLERLKRLSLHSNELEEVVEEVRSCVDGEGRMAEKRSFFFLPHHLSSFPNSWAKPPRSSGCPSTPTS